MNDAEQRPWERADKADGTHSEGRWRLWTIAGHPSTLTKDSMGWGKQEGDKKQAGLNQNNASSR